MNILKRSLIRAALRSAALDGSALIDFLRHKRVVGVSFATDYGDISIPINSKSIIESFLRGEYFGRDVIDAFLRLEAPSRTLFNIGANVGSSALSIASSGRYERIVCFEPDPKNFESLGRNTEKFGIIDCRRVALGRQPGKLQLNVNPESIGRHSFRTDFGRGSIDVEVASLNDIADAETSFDVFMDVEGWEVEVLAGAQNVLMRCGICALEWNGHLLTPAEKEKAVKILEAAGFQSVVDLAGDARKRNLREVSELDLQRDVAFVRA